MTISNNVKNLLAANGYSNETKFKTQISKFLADRSKGKKWASKPTRTLLNSLYKNRAGIGETVFEECFNWYQSLLLEFGIGIDTEGYHVYPNTVINSIQEQTITAAFTPVVETVAMPVAAVIEPVKAVESKPVVTTGAFKFYLRPTKNGATLPAGTVAKFVTMDEAKAACKQLAMSLKMAVSIVHITN